MNRYPKPIENLIESFGHLPGIGRKTAERFVFFLLKRTKDELFTFSNHLKELAESQFLCPECFNFSESQGLCPICSSSTRDRSILCVVEEVHDLNVIENTNAFRGLYHILGGKIDPIEGIGADRLNVRQLLDRLKSNPIQEVILALNPDIQGEGTILYLKQLLKQSNVKITLLARGLPMGGDIEYADEVTLSNALRGRQEI